MFATKLKKQCNASSLFLLMSFSMIEDNLKIDCCSCYALASEISNIFAFGLSLSAKQTAIVFVDYVVF